MLMKNSLALAFACGICACTQDADVHLYVALDQEHSESLIKRFESQSGLRVRARFDTEAVVVDEQLRIEHSTGHRFTTELIEAFPGAIQSVRVSKPSLEDVFLRTTGHSFRDAEAETK